MLRLQASGFTVTEGWAYFTYTRSGFRRQASLRDGLILHIHAQASGFRLQATYLLIECRLTGTPRRVPNG
jgi:hypothetical protein